MQHNVYMPSFDAITQLLWDYLNKSLKLKIKMNALSSSLFSSSIFTVSLQPWHFQVQARGQPLFTLPS